jgi:hypothetical protein
MHDLDRTLRTYDSESANEMQLEDHEWTGEMSQEEELELAQELLTLSGEAELDEFFKKLLKTAGKYAKPLAKKLLPIAGKVAGAYFGPLGSQIGGKLGTLAANLFEVDETLPPAERELEMAKQVIRLSCTAAKHAGSAPPNADPIRVASGAVMQAAREMTAGNGNANGIAGSSVARRRPPASGRWVRRGNRLHIFGAY